MLEGRLDPALDRRDQRLGGLERSPVDQLSRERPSRLIPVNFVPGRRDTNSMARIKLTS